MPTEHQPASVAQVVHRADENPPLAMAVAVATYLAHKRAELDAPREDLLRRAAKAEFPDGPPPAVVAWLEQEGVAA
jgi:hypothetical protein